MQIINTASNPTLKNKLYLKHLFPLYNVEKSI